ncbi:hypothetical protein GCM10009665_09000 [Kitasatospora nipponensis]|uniref:Uncharacterized protein n=1 Tax=Kitasatospora nipponensis TaxID=258049 RepID=A0ABP4GCN0_9ACTN
MNPRTPMETAGQRAYGAPLPGSFIGCIALRGAYGAAPTPGKGQESGKAVSATRECSRRPPIAGHPPRPEAHGGASRQRMTPWAILPRSHPISCLPDCSRPRMDTATTRGGRRGVPARLPPAGCALAAGHARA